MRMPFSEFVTSGDLKFIIVFIIFSGWAIVHFFKKLSLRKQEVTIDLLQYHNTKINNAAFWILILSILSLLLGLMHSFYFIGKTGGIAPNLIFQGVSYALITPVLGLCLFICCKTLKGIFNEISSK
ncbi:hypothetical protein GCM10011344_36780 [Dokdonia pacifica]|uniref:MotA/TolQ/ExbB proton channel family protein n=1 Tax=Dokdonia pacifica TaxID=1627892 RepID=A0A239AYP8_9FLAO|nr:hypothetical protein [Dokdonia pacifica]GGG32482.1 hypothetical protein GCM10011344_36780 [Dokdonia pacifica]SNS00757.1 hypothetical protein SAMN06265376_105225 [Dokdonia pacifica]